MTDDEKQLEADTDTDTDTEADVEESAVEEAEADDAELAEAEIEIEETQAEPVAALPAQDSKLLRVAVLGVLPFLVVVLALGAAFLKWQGDSVRRADAARTESMQAARDIVADILSYQPDKIDQQLGSARDLLTGDFQKTYAALTTDVVIPGAKQQQISAVATAPAAASVSATPDHAVVLVFVNQTVTVGQGAPSNTTSSVRVTLDKVGDRWLISEFEPV